MLAWIRPLFAQQRGATAIEYAFVASLISVAIYSVAVTIGTELSTTFSSVAAKL
jgi:pilus assembly protein Flp/PilA